ncbi:hypothetical protein OEG84_20570 [Hoeflea sp. G2-23]|uniref:Uncharacterized protein n=1 Tax=Hoeflea algicola TaxID=2983763 RepID=A0ABT3ZE38_9HYPH|nr:hypothetical protein [Hoeflea algicola]MCY0150028.1 hypothetical protein [Hoeflea algicola]
MQLGQDPVNEFTRNGFIVIKGFYHRRDNGAVQTGIHAIIGAVMARQDGVTGLKCVFAKRYQASNCHQ